jgi:hypothetical protein
MAIKFDQIPAKHIQCTTKVNYNFTTKKILRGRNTILKHLSGEDNYFGRDPTFPKLSKRLYLFMQHSLHVESNQ